MARNNKINMPQSTAGITRYFDDYKSKISIRPEVIIAIIVAIVIVIVILNSLYGGSFQ